MTVGPVKTHGCLIFVQEVMRNTQRMTPTVRKLSLGWTMKHKHQTHCHNFNFSCVFLGYCNTYFIGVEQSGLQG